MSGETTLTVIGNLTADPELRHTPTGTAVVSFTVASTPRRLDRSTGTWNDGDTLFMRCTAWRQTAEHIAQSLTRGARIWVHGELKPHRLETYDGAALTVVDLQVDDIGPSLKHATAVITRTRTDSEIVPTPQEIQGRATSDVTPSQI